MNSAFTEFRIVPSTRQGRNRRKGPEGRFILKHGMPSKGGRERGGSAMEKRRRLGCLERKETKKRIKGEEQRNAAWTEEKVARLVS